MIHALKNFSSSVAIVACFLFLTSCGSSQRSEQIKRGQELLAMTEEERREEYFQEYLEKKEYFSIELAELKEVDSDAYEAAKIIWGLGPLAEAAPIDSSFLPVSPTYGVSAYERMIEHDTSLCKATISKEIYYGNYWISGREDEKVFKVDSTLVQDGSDERCDVALIELPADDRTLEITWLATNKELTSTALEILRENKSPIVRLSVVTNKKGEIVYAKFYEELKGFKGLFSKLLAVQSPPGPGGNPTASTYVYNYVLERAMKQAQ